MISRIHGRLMSKVPPLVEIEVNSGLVYELNASMTTVFQLPELGQAVKLYTQLIVREDAHLLFGFNTTVERDLFRLLIKISGVGPKLALAILSSLDVASFKQCIEFQDTASLVRIPGVGKKTAERLIIEMRDKLGVDSSGGVTLPALHADSHVVSPQQEAIQALVSLGYKPQEASKMVHKVHTTESSNVESIIRAALKGVSQCQPTETAS